MKVNYRGFELDAHREKCMAGYSLLYYTAMQDGREWLCGFEDSAEKVVDKIKQLKEWVNNFYHDLENKWCPECGANIFKVGHNKWECDDCYEIYELK